MTKENSKLSKIGPFPNEPIDLFHMWFDEAKLYIENFLPTINIATINKEHGVLNRTVVLRGSNEFGFIFVTERNSRKFHDLYEDPRIAATFLWRYSKNEEVITRQIRINGTVTKLSEEEIVQLYAEEPLYAKIRNEICKCGQPVDWTELKGRYDTVLKEYNEGLHTFSKTEFYTALRIIPTNFDFYLADVNAIADRILFTKDPEGKWGFTHIYA